LVSIAKGRLVQLEGQAWYFPFRYMQPISNNSYGRLSVPTTLIQGLPKAGGAAGTHPITLVPLVPLRAATALRVHLQGQAVPHHVSCELPCSQDWAAVADIPTNINTHGGLSGTKAGFDAFKPLTGWHMLWGYTVSTWAGHVFFPLCMGAKDVRCVSAAVALEHKFQAQAAHNICRGCCCIVCADQHALNGAGRLRLTNHSQQ
jgi:hypothetical protein